MRRITPLLIGLALIASGCGQDHAAHDHTGELASHDHGDVVSDGEETGYDHHGNPLSEELFYSDLTVDGVRVEFTIQTFLGVGGRGGHVVTDIASGSHAAAVIHVTDAATGTPISPTGVLGWIGLADDESCPDAIEGFVSGMLTRAPVVDLSAFFVLALNRESGISVIEPSVDVAGMTQLFTIIPLIAPASAWALTASGRFAAVAIPSTGQTAVVDLESFETMAHLDVGGAPMAVVADPSRERAWVGGTAAGVTVIDLADFSIAFEIEVGTGVPAIAVTEDYAFVASGSDLLVIAAQSGAVQAAIEVDGGDITSLAAADGKVWVATERTIVALDPSGARLWERPADAVTGLWMADGGSVVVAASGAHAQLIDASSGGLLAEIDAGGRVTDAVDAFGEIVLAVPERGYLLRVDPRRAGEAAGVIRVELGASGMAPTISVAEARSAIIVAVPGQDQVQLIPAGATAPAGAFQGHGLIPTATATVDRSLVETAPGVFTGRFRAPEPGAYRMALLTEGPRVVACFDFEVAASLVPASAQVPDISLVDVVGERAGGPTTVTFDVDGESVYDVEVMVVAIAGAWQNRMPAEPTGSGSYRASMTLPTAGIYQLFFRIPDLGLDFASFPNFYLDVAAS